MPFDRSKYPKNWREISDEIRFDRAAGMCEWKDGKKRCEALHGHPHPITGSKVVLTTAHLNHKPMDVRRSNLMAMCQMHHLRYDSKLHAENMKRKKAERAARIVERINVQCDKETAESYHQSTQKLRTNVNDSGCYGLAAAPSRT